MPNEDRLTRADLEKLKEAVKKNERKHISHNNEAKYYPNSKREPEKPIFDFTVPPPLVVDRANAATTGGGGWCVSKNCLLRRRQGGGV